ncbi:hypothetical protein LC065_16870 [Halobacillus litoralis]|uniref:hypothetical protein n=1 Tax=Halobacillus litoralis TaxID=45668 RepID=UPI001CFEF561|nr:hypothetical protein [Halobacillus litoralis]WLR47174.1 hypothetical protein LC065_16870 [Halobacillus litoralis]
MFMFPILFGLCVLFFPLQGIKDFRNEKTSHKVTRLIFIGFALLLLTAGGIDLADFINNARN